MIEPNRFFFEILPPEHVITLEGRADCRVHLIPGCWFGFPSQANHTFHSSKVGGSVPDMLGKNLTCPPAAQRESLHWPYTYSKGLHDFHRRNIECVAYSIRRLLTADLFYFLFIHYERIYKGKEVTKSHLSYFQGRHVALALYFKKLHLKCQCEP